MKKLKDILRLGSETKTVLTILMKNKAGIVGIIIVVGFVFVGLLSPFIAPYDPIEMHLDKRFQSPNNEFLLGTDEFGRDILSRIIYGARVSFSVSVVSVAIAMCIGVLVGSISGYYGGKIDMIIMRLLDIANSFPYLLLAVGIMAILGRGIDKLILVLPLIFWTTHARITRSLALSLKNKEFIEAAKIFGASDFRIIRSHILINVLPHCIVIGTFQLGSAIITETSLSFLGLGVNPPMPSWGSMLTNARGYILTAPYLAIIPGVVISLVILGFNLLGDALRDALDPRLRL